MGDKVTILLLATNQLELACPRFGDEHREIENSIKRGSFRDSFQTISKPGVRASDLAPYLLENNPHIVHLSAQGSAAEGIILEDDAGNARPMRADELAGILKILKGKIRFVFLNVCYSKAHAETISHHVVDYAIGMNGTIDDDPAVTFAASFYEMLAFGKSVKDAFEVARRVPGSDAPILFIRDGVNHREPLAGVAERGQKSINDGETAAFISTPGWYRRLGRVRAAVILAIMLVVVVLSLWLGFGRSNGTREVLDAVKHSKQEKPGDQNDNQDKAGEHKLAIEPLER